MTRTFGLIITLGALAVGGLVAAQNIGPSAQNVASPAPSAPGPAPGPEAGPPPPAGGGQKRIALVVGNSGYQAAPLKTAANDAGLIAQTLQAAGFDVAGARDLDQELTRRALRDFLDKAQASGPDTAAFVYLSGYGVQFEGDNYFVPIDAKLARAADVPVEAVRMSDYTRPLAAMNFKANIIVLDAGRANPFAKSGPPLAGGLALVDAEPGTLIAFNAAPGTVAPDGDGPYGAYAQALAEMISRRRPAAVRHIQSRAPAGQRNHKGRRSSLAIGQYQDLVRILRARRRRATTAGFIAAGGGSTLALDPRDRPARRLCGRARARHATGLYGFHRCLSG